MEKRRKTSEGQSADFAKLKLKFQACSPINSVRGEKTSRGTNIAPFAVGLFVFVFNSVFL